MLPTAISGVDAEEKFDGSGDGEVTERNFN